MGESKISVFRHLFGDEDRAQRANAAFEEAYAELVDGGRSRRARRRRDRSSGCAGAAAPSS